MRLTTRQRIVFLAVVAIAAGVLAYFAIGWVAAPIGCEGSCELQRRYWSVIAAVAIPVLANISVDSKENHRG